MHMSGSRQLPASKAVVWEKLNDVETLKRCIPGCETLEKTSDTSFKATSALKIGPMSVRFSGDVALKNLDPPNSYRIEGSGKGGPAGFASGGADVRLEPSEGGTLLTYDVDATVGGKIAQLGSRLIDATAASMAGQFFDKFAAEVAAAADGSPAATMPVPVPARPAAGAGVPIWAWVAGGLVLIALVYYLAR
ncbi:MAG: carbon monoxide dehydrogenase subunit G [Hyphomicrobiaceae bacterium]